MPRNMPLTSTWCLDPSRSLPWAPSCGCPGRVPQSCLTWSAWVLVTRHLPQSFLGPSVVVRNAQGQQCHLGGLPPAWTHWHRTQSRFLSCEVLSDSLHLFPQVPPLPSQPGTDQMLQGGVGLSLASVPGGAPGVRRAPAGGCSVWTGEAGLPSTEQTTCDSHQTQDKFWTLGRHQRSTVSPRFERPVGTRICSQLWGFWPQPKVGVRGHSPSGQQAKQTKDAKIMASGPSNSSSQVRDRCSRPWASVRRHGHSLLATPAAQGSPRPSGSSRGGHASASEELADTAPPGQQAASIHTPWPLMDMALAWPPRLVWSGARWGRGVPRRMAPLLQLCLLWRCGTGEGTVNAERGRILGGHCVGLNHVDGRGLPLSYIHNSEFTTKETHSTFPHETCTRGHCPRRQHSPPKRRGSQYSLAAPWMMECQEYRCSQH